MNFKISNKEFYKRHNLEIERFLSQRNSLNIININSKENTQSFNSETIFINPNFSISSQIEKLGSKKYDNVVLSDLLEQSENIYEDFSSINKILSSNGKLTISSINTRWGVIMKLLEKLNLKLNTSKFSYIHFNKIANIASGTGFEMISTKTRQFLPFKIFYFGNLINLILEILFFNFNLGIKTYITLRKNSQQLNEFRKTIIIPAKNEEGNLVELVNRIPTFKQCELIFSIGSSKDKTLEVAEMIKNTNDNFKIKVIEQTKSGKANAVWEAVNISNGEVIAILDSDISVDPEELTNFFEIIDNNKADFVNGTRLIYDMEKGSMRFINKIGNRVFQYLIGKVIKVPITDSLCGTKVFKKDLINKIKWWQFRNKLFDPFGDFDLLFTAAYFAEKITEYPIHYRARTYGRTQISRFRDGYKLIKYILTSFLILNTSKKK